MNCVSLKCNSHNLKIIRTDHAHTMKALPREFIGLNITRRLVRCLDCKHTFYSIELPEEDYHDLTSAPGRIETQRVRMR